MSRQKIHLRIVLPIFLGLVIVCSGANSILAQSNIRIFHTQEHEAKSDTYLGRDLWFAIPLNYSPTDRSTKYFNVYVNSPRNTTVNFQITGGPIVRRPVTAGKVAIFTSPTPTKPSGDIPLSTELYSSGVVEPKAIHVWSDDADIAVYFLSRRSYSSGGMYVIPSTGWGKDYAIGAYESIFDPTGQADWPSEFAIVANQDNTLVSITPTWDIRKDQFPSVIEHPKGQTFSVNLNKGECVQFQTVLPISDGECDLTGTIISSNNPVGVMGCSVDPYIYFPYGYGDYCLSMLQPLRTWSDTYFTSPFAGRIYGGDAYCVIASKPQIIFRNGVQVATLSQYGDHLFIYDDVAASPPSLWTSTAPFELMQYVPSATFGTGDPLAGKRNQGDADMCSINPADQFGKKVYFQTPTIDLASGQTEFTNYVNILLPAGHESKTTYDGILLNAAALPPNIVKRERFIVPNTQWEAMRLTYKANSGEGSHTVLSDTGVGVYLYGYGTDDSYSWAGSLGTRTHNDPDTIPPVAIADGPCFCAHVRISDTGPGQSKLSSFIVDTAFNMTFYPDPNFIPGNGTDSSYYDMCVIDSTIEAYLSVSIYDLAGNRTTVFSTYKPQFVKFSPNPLNFGTVNVGNNSFKYDTICNTGESTFHFKAANLNLSNGTKQDNIGFSIDSAADFDIPVGGCMAVKIKFSSLVPPTVKDTMTLVDDCIKIITPIIGNGGAADFDVHPYAFDCTPINAGRPTSNYFITNPSGIDIQIDSIWLDDNINFGYNVANPPTNDYRNGKMTVPNSNTLSGQYAIVVTFSPQTTGFMKTAIHVEAKGGVIKVDTISGYGCGPNLVSSPGNLPTTCDIPVSFKVPIQNTGTLFDSIISVTGIFTGSGFSQVKIEDPLGNALTVPYHLDSSAVIYATVLYTPKLGTSGCFTDTIVVTRLGGDRAVATTVTACVTYPELSVKVDTVNFGNLAFGGSKVQNFGTICNSGKDPMHVSAIQQLSTPGSTAFALINLYKVGGVPVTLPTDLAPGQCMDIYGEFDPTKSSASNQIDSVGTLDNACNGDSTLFFIASVHTGPPSIQGFKDAAILSCDVLTDSVKFRNTNAVPSKITAITIAGADQGNFTSLATPPITVPSVDSVGVPILFTPNAKAGVTVYNALVVLTVVDGAGNTSYDTAVVSGIGQGIDLTVASQFTNPVDTVGNTVLLPIQLSVNKNGLTTPLSVLDIRRIELTYTYNQDILDIVGNDIKGAVTFTDPAWSVDLATSKINVAANTLQLNITGPALTDADLAKPLGTIAFRASIPKTGTQTSVTLATTNFLNSASNPVSNCMTIAKKDSTFNLIYLCGDSSLQSYMNGAIIFRAFPVNPNPAGSVNGSVLNFRYTAGVEGAVSLVIYDELGKEVAHVIDDQSMPAGTYQVGYDISRLTEGTYIYRYTLNNKSTTSGRVVIQK